MNILKTTWSAFTPEIAKIYLDGHGNPSNSSKDLMASVLKDIFGTRQFRLADFGCGNGHLFGFFRARGLNCEYIGFDFSASLVAAGRERYGSEPRVRFCEVDIEDPELKVPSCDIVLYSHVIEMLQSPQKSLLAACRTAPMAMIRFFEPPTGDFDITEILAELPELQFPRSHYPNIFPETNRPAYSHSAEIHPDRLEEDIPPSTFETNVAAHTL